MKVMNQCLALLFLLLILKLTEAPPVRRRKRTAINTAEDSLSYLSTYGYAQKSSTAILADLVDVESAQKTALRIFQKVWGLSITGELDDLTKELMETDRCGNSDEVLFLQAQGLRKRYSAVDRWHKKNLTYSIIKYSNKLNRGDFDNAVKIAFNLWAAPSHLFFSEDPDNPDIVILFAKGDHGDEHPFDGRKGTLAHAFFPKYGGDLHIDDDEPWTYFTHEGREITRTVAHELGHSLGLQHSKEKDSIMNPYYKYKERLELELDDILGIQTIYGEDTNVSSTEALPSLDKWCSKPGFDAAIQSPDGSGDIFLFHEDEMMVINKENLEQQLPIKTVLRFSALKKSVDAALLLPSVYVCFYKKTFEHRNCYNYDMYFFTGSTYYRYQSTNGVAYLEGSGEISSIFPGIPAHLDAAFARKEEGINVIYFTKGKKLYRFIRGVGVDEGYPKQINGHFWGFPSKLDAAVSYTMKHGAETYFTTLVFYANEYYLLPHGSSAVSNEGAPYPRSVSAWFLQCNIKLGALKDSGAVSAEHWAVDLLNFEPALPKLQPGEYFNKNNELLELQDTGLPRSVESDDVVDTDLDPQELARYNEEVPNLTAAAADPLRSMDTSSILTVAIYTCLIIIRLVSI